MNLSELQKKYPEFVYESCGWTIGDRDMTAVFCFRLGGIEFRPSVVIRGVEKAQIAKLGEAAVSNLVFHLGLAEIPTYWKAACSPKIVIKAGYLDKTQIKFWQDLIFNMGQFFYENRLPFIKPDFAICAPKHKTAPVVSKKFSKRYLVPLGGGKDSLVTLEVIREAKKEAATFALNANIALKNVVEAAGGKNISVERIIDKKIVELNARDYLNGHTPFSSILAVLGVALAAMFDFGAVAISQERSSNEGNVGYRGKKVNHQYSKTLEFENKWRKYSEKYLAKNIAYFSFLRPLYEIQIAKIFSSYTKYFDSFLSCNKPFTIAARESGVTGWCRKCSKCLSVFSMIYPFAGKDQTVKIFGGNLFEDGSLLPVMRELLGEGKCKPMECVGTFAEMRSAFYLSLEEAGARGNVPPLLGYFRDNILPKYPRTNSDAKKILVSFGAKDNLPACLRSALRKKLAGAKG